MKSLRSNLICAVLLTAFALAVVVQTQISALAHACPGKHCPTLP